MPRKPSPATLSLWKERLDRYEHAGQSVREFCGSEGTSLASFYQWRRKLRTESAVAVPAAPRFQAIQIVTSGAHLGYRPSIVRLVDGVEIELGSDLAVVEAIVRHLLGADGCRNRAGHEPC